LLSFSLKLKDNLYQELSTVGEVRVEHLLGNSVVQGRIGIGNSFPERKTSLSG
jgi:hypothetical protein